MAKTKRLKGKKYGSQARIVNLKEKYGDAVTLIRDTDRKEGSMTVFKPDHNRMIFWLALAGLNEYEMASVIGIADSTFGVWKRNKPNFMAAMKAGHMEAVATSAHSLFRVGNGYERQEERLIPNRVKEYDPDTGRVTKEYTEVIREKVQKYYQPNVQALLRFLAAKFPEVWGERSEVVHTNINNHSIDTTKLSKKKLKLLQEIAQSGVKADQKIAKAKEKKELVKVNLSRKQKKQKIKGVKDKK